MRRASVLKPLPSIKTISSGRHKDKFLITNNKQSYFRFEDFVPPFHATEM